MGEWPEPGDELAYWTGYAFRELAAAAGDTCQPSPVYPHEEVSRTRSWYGAVLAVLRAQVRRANLCEAELAESRKDDGHETD